MTSLDIYLNILNNKTLLEYPFKYCLVDKNKRPYKSNGELAKPNCEEDFSKFEEIDLDKLEEYEGLGVSIQASHITAIDVDHCFSEPFNANSLDERGKEIINLFKNYCYIEFSFSGTGLRIFFKLSSKINNYKEKYFIKNSKNQIEFYLPEESIRYVTITGRTLYNNELNDLSDNNEFINTLHIFLDKYMKRTVKTKNVNLLLDEDKDINELLRLTKILYLKNYEFQDLWFSKAPGSNSDESERDFHILTYLYNNVTKNKEKLKIIFESSPYFKSKDKKHMYKWEQGNYRYFNFMYQRL